LAQQREICFVGSPSEKFSVFRRFRILMGVAGWRTRYSRGAVFYIASARRSTAAENVAEGDWADTERDQRKT